MASHFNSKNQNLVCSRDLAAAAPDKSMIDSTIATEVFTVTAAANDSSSVLVRL